MKRFMVIGIPHVKRASLFVLLLILVLSQSYAQESNLLKENDEEKIEKKKESLSFNEAPLGPPNIVNLQKDGQGWKVKVDGNDFYIKGVVWGAIPSGQNYSYNLWGFSDDYIKKVLDQDFNLMKKAGINTIRSFGSIPPKWVTYIYKKYAIMTVINHLAGRYGILVNGTWVEKTNYSDPKNREAIKNEIIDMVNTYKDVPGILMFAFGNENNYGLEWKSFEIENLPVGEQQKSKAKYLYTLYDDIIKTCKKIDTNHPYAIVNGDIQYIDLIREECPEVDVLGSNAYRGIGFTNLWSETKLKLDKPVLLMEFGCDAYNAKDGMEDQYSQANFLKGQWNEMYRKSYGNGEEGNSIGGLVFQWRDEWWKSGLEINLDEHDLTASWSNGGYDFDYQEGENNMNEEWWGICSMGKPDGNGVYRTEPRVAYHVLSRVWDIDPYRMNKQALDTYFNGIDVKQYALEGDIRLLKKFKLGYDAFNFSGGEIRLEMVFGGDHNDVEKNGKDGMYFTHGEMLFLNFKFHPFKGLTGSFSLNILANVAERELEFAYGQRGKKYYVLTTESDSGGYITKTTSGFKEVKDQERVALYNFESTYMHQYFDFEAFYHVPRFHWGYEGDTYNLLQETTNMKNIDLYDGSAPFGFQFSGKKNDFLKGLKILIGPEVYWGANPKIMIKYMYDFGYLDFAVIHSEDFVRSKNPAAGKAIEKATRQSTAYLRTKVIPYTIWEIGAIMSGTEKIGDSFVYTTKTSGSGLNNSGYAATRDTIRFTDTLGAKTKLTFDILKRAAVDVGYQYAGLVADGGNPINEGGSIMPQSGLGNKMVVDGGLLFTVNKFIFSLRGMYRWNLLEANPEIAPNTLNPPNFTPGVEPRNREDDPFAVIGNRKCYSGEVVFTYDQTPATYFYHWDNDKREDAFFAFNLAFNYTYYPTPTDSATFYYSGGQRTVSFGEGLPAEHVWKGLSKLVFNPARNLKMIYRLEVGFQQSTVDPGGPAGDSYRPVQYYGLDFDFTFFKKYFLLGYLKKDAWGPYDYQKEWNLTYPWQWMLDFCVLIDTIMDYDLSNKIGIRYVHRLYDRHSGNEDYQNGDNRGAFEISTYYTLKF